jgi:uncharacterized RDD family membrane protein YckC
MEFEADKKEEVKSELIPASLGKRSVAFFMDAVLLFILIQMIYLLIPKFFDENSRREFNNLINQISLFSNDDHFDSQKMATFIQESNISEQTFQIIITIFLLSFLLPILYFFCGEAFFQGQTLGKATFGLRTVSFEDHGIPSLLKHLIRAIIKGITTIFLVPSPIILLSMLNFLYCLLNPNKRCIHDLLSGTVTTQPAPSTQ